MISKISNGFEKSLSLVKKGNKSEGIDYSKTNCDIFALLFRESEMAV